MNKWNKSPVAVCSRCGKYQSSDWYLGKDCPERGCKGAYIAATQEHDWKTCPVCNGLGVIDNLPCEACQRFGVIYARQR